MGNLREGDGGSPYTAPPKENPGPFVPAPRKRDSLMLANRDDDQPVIKYMSEKGFGLDDSGRAFMQTGMKWYDAGEYDVETHGLPVPLAKNKKRSNLQIANITPKDFTPPPIRYIDHIKTKDIKDAEMKHFKNFIKSTGSSWDLSKKKSKLKIG